MGSSNPTASSIRTTSADTAPSMAATNHPHAVTHATMPRETMTRP
jgi:hypothetical protein